MTDTQSLEGERADALAALQSAPVVDDGAWALPQAQATVKWKVLAGLLATSLVGLGAFTFGVRYQKNRPVAATGGAGAFGRGFPGGAGGGTGAGPSADVLAQIFGGSASTPSSGGSAAPASASEVRGKLTKVDATTLTVTKADGSTVTVHLGDATQVGRRSATSAADLTEGSDVMVSGTAGADGVVAADQVTTGDLPAEPAPAGTAGSAPATEAPGLGGLLPG